MTSKIDISERLIKWHSSFGRHDLPWQKNKNPYHVWISEIMLQQTQVNTVIPYFEKFIKQFPNITALANTDEDQILSYWSGLGYYSRARNIYAAAQSIKNLHNGKFPEDYDDIVNLPGIGRSTAGAILAFSFNKKYAILDANVKRVLLRFFAIEEPVNKTKTIKRLWSISDSILPNQNISTYTQAIMDLGATVCKRSNPKCVDCPLNDGCLARKNNASSRIPVKNKSKDKPVKYSQFYIYEYNKRFFLIKNTKTKIWGQLWLPPTEPIFQEKLNRDDLKILKTGERSCTFSHFKLSYKYTHIHLCKEPNDNSFGLWFDFIDLTEVGLPAPIKKLLTELSN